MRYMFYGCQLDGSHFKNWNVSKVTTLAYMFYNCLKLNKDTMRKQVNEEIRPLRSCSPYKVRRDKGFVKDATPQMNQRYLLNKAMEINNFYERQKMFGELDKLEPLFVDLFKQIMNIKGFLEAQMSQPLIDKKQISTIRKIAKKLDKI